MAVSLYNKYYLELKFRDRIYGGLPGDEETFEKWIAQKNFPNPEETSPADNDLDLKKEVENSVNKFRRDDTGIYVATYQVKAMIAQSASLLGITVEKRGSKQTLKEGLFIKGINEKGNMTAEKIYILPVRTEPDGVETFTGNVPTPQGSRSILKASEYCEYPTLKMQLWVLGVRMATGNTKKVTFEDMKMILEHAQESGLGALRKFESGKFDVVDFSPWDDYAAKKPILAAEIENAEIPTVSPA